MAAVFSPRYGAITSIFDSQLTYSMADSTGTEYLFEIHPLNIEEQEIRKYELELNSNSWLIHYRADLLKPTEQTIEHALENGFIIKLYFNVDIYDNYGLKHRLEFDEKAEKYIFQCNPANKLIDAKLFQPFNNNLINFIKTTNDSQQIVLLLNNSARLVHSLLFTEILELKNKIKDLEDKVQSK